MAMLRRAVTLFGLVLVLIGPLIGGSCIESPARSDFLVENLTIEPAKVEPDEVVTITVSVTNTHDTWGIYSLALNINGVREAEKQANVDAGGTRNVSFSVTRENPGRYTVFINGLSGSFTVVTRVSPP